MLVVAQVCSAALTINGTACYTVGTPIGQNSQYSVEVVCSAGAASKLNMDDPLIGKHAGKLTVTYGVKDATSCGWEKSTEATYHTMPKVNPAATVAFLPRTFPPHHQKPLTTSLSSCVVTIVHPPSVLTESDPNNLHMPMQPEISISFKEPSTGSVVMEGAAGIPVDLIAEVIHVGGDVARRRLLQTQSDVPSFIEICRIIVDVTYDQTGATFRCLDSTSDLTAANNILTKVKPSFPARLVVLLEWWVRSEGCTSTLLQAHSNILSLLLILSSCAPFVSAEGHMRPHQRAHQLPEPPTRKI